MRDQSNDAKNLYESNIFRPEYVLNATKNKLYYLGDPIAVNEYRRKTGCSPRLESLSVRRN